MFNAQRYRKQLALKLDPGFNFAVTSEGKPGSDSKATIKRHRSGSYLPRQAKRRAAFLERKKKHISEEEEAKTRQDKNVCEQETGDILNKKTSTSMQTDSEEDKSVGNCSLNLNPSPPPPPPPPPTLSTRRVVVTAGRLRVSFNQIDGEDDVNVDGNEEEEGPPAGSEDAGGASALAVDADPRHLRERARGCRKFMEELFRVAKDEYNEDRNYDKFKKVEECYYDTVAKLDMADKCFASSVHSCV